MVIMALDHVRDFFHADAMKFNPEDLTKASAALFLTRWITHFCAPTFMFLAGVGAALRLSRGATKAELSRYLWTRGLWLMVLEVTAFRFALNFNLFGDPVLLVVLWTLGLSMIALSVLIYIPVKWLTPLCFLVIALHNLADPIQAANLGAWGPLWHFLHEPGVLTTSPTVVFMLYPAIPWIAVMALGFCFGPVLQEAPEKRRKTILLRGAILTVAFLAIRMINVYGDPQPRVASESLVMTVLSFLRTTKYPPSLDYILMTLGPSLIVLWYFYGRQISEKNPLTVIGRVPLFYFIVHFGLAHLLIVPLSILRYGSAWFLLHAPPSAGGQSPYPPDFGYSLPVVYLAWMVVLAIMYPLCVWYGRVKGPVRRWI